MHVRHESDRVEVVLFWVPNFELGLGIKLVKLLLISVFNVKILKHGVELLIREEGVVVVTSFLGQVCVVTQGDLVMVLLGILFFSHTETRHYIQLDVY